MIRENDIVHLTIKNCYIFIKFGSECLKILTKPLYLFLDCFPISSEDRSLTAVLDVSEETFEANLLKTLTQLHLSKS